MKILIIGNGFDLEHNLPTKYWDFIQFIKKYRNLENYSKQDINRIDLDENVKKFLLMDDVFNVSKRDDALKEMDNILSKNIWIDYFIKKSNIENKGWIDFESEISFVIKRLEWLIEFNISRKENPSSEMTNYLFYNEANNFIRNKLDEKGLRHNESHNGSNFCEDSAEIIINELIYDLNNLIRCLEIYLEKVIGEIEINYVASDIVDIKDIQKVLSFNYTNTYQRVYEKSENKIEYDYIHGKANIGSKENNMVLGIDEYLIGDERNCKLEFIQFKKYFQRIYKKTGCIYKNWISEINENKDIHNEVFIFGHSLDVTDKEVLKEIIMSPNTTTTIFYYDKNVYAQQIKNLVKIITQDELIAGVYGPNPRIIFKQQQKRKKLGCNK